MKIAVEIQERRCLKVFFLFLVSSVSSAGERARVSRELVMFLTLFLFSVVSFLLFRLVFFLCSLSFRALLTCGTETGTAHRSCDFLTPLLVILW